MKYDRSKAGVFFKISGFTQVEIDDIWIRTPIIKQALKDIKARKRQEQRLINLGKARDSVIGEARRKIREMLGNKRKPRWLRNQEQIQRGFDVAEKWRQENDK